MAFTMVPLGAIKSHDALNGDFSTLKSQNQKNYVTFQKLLKFPANLAQPELCRSNTLEMTTVQRQHLFFRLQNSIDFGGV